MNDYEQQRALQVRLNQERLEKLGISAAVKAVTAFRLAAREKRDSLSNIDIPRGPVRQTRHSVKHFEMASTSQAAAPELPNPADAGKKKDPTKKEILFGWDYWLNSAFHR